MNYYRDLPDRQSCRLKEYDYSQNGEYFVTICTKYGSHFFGDIKNGIVGLSNIGNIAAKFWQEIPRHFPFVRLDEWIVMPNHLHGVLVFENSRCTVGTRNFASVQREFGGLQKNSLSSIMQSFKAAVKRWCNQNNYEDFIWHGRFYDQIIRNEESSNRIRAYIKNNPSKWQKDVENRINNLNEFQIRNHYDRLFDK